MDELIFLWLNQWVGQNPTFDITLALIFLVYVKSLPFMLLVWSMWFLADTDAERTEMRERLTAILLATIPIIAATRVLADTLPFVKRPIHDERYEANVVGSEATLDGWSSMPSDHASVFFALAVSLFLVDRRYGSFALFWTTFIVCLPRLMVGYHWMSDILGGAALGITFAVILVPTLTRLLRQMGTIPYLEVRGYIAYPLLFLATFEIANVFAISRITFSILFAG